MAAGIASSTLCQSYDCIYRLPAKFRLDTPTAKRIDERIVDRIVEELTPFGQIEGPLHRQHQGTQQGHHSHPEGSGIGDLPGCEQIFLEEGNHTRPQ